MLDSNMDAPVTRQEIIDGYRFMLKRPPESEDVIEGRLRSNNFRTSCGIARSLRGRLLMTTAI
ncbi:MAG: hypothetical protein LBG43_02190 [Treponema sp.]|jgi:hypothetical protein|nr:hypothetical protein [Treponema sp.]